MRTALSVGQLATIALSFSPVVSALSWPRWLPDIDTLIVRQDSPPSNSSNTDSNSSTPTPSGSSNPADATNLNTGGVTPTGNKGSSNSSSSTKAPATHTQYNPVDAPGSVVMVTPAPNAQALNLYKIGETVTWGWNYTNLQGTPTAVDVLASIASTATFTLTQNMTFATPQSFLWDTAAYEADNVGQPLLTEQYTLVIYDADGSPTDQAEAGYLAPFAGFKFGMYQPMGATPLSEWHCVTCSAAFGTGGTRAVGMAAAMSVLTVLSFTWFVVGFGVV